MFRGKQFLVVYVLGLNYLGNLLTSLIPSGYLHKTQVEPNGIKTTDKKI